MQRAILILLPVIPLVMLAGCAAVDLSRATSPGAALPAQNARRSTSESLPEPLSKQLQDDSESQAPDVPFLPPAATSNEQKVYNEDDGEVRPIDLPTALQLADARNPLVAFTREQVRQSYARLERADVLWLPSLRAGASFNRHEGAIQDTAGIQSTTSRGAFYGGLGAGAFGAGPPMVPGIWANFHLTDAIFQPLAAEQAVGARRAAAGTALNDTLLRVALAYLELLRAQQELAIAKETDQHAQALFDVCQAYAKAGQGLQSDADRAATELALRKTNVVRAEESIAVASARLAQLLHLKPTLEFEPIEPVVTPLDLTPRTGTIDDLIAQALSARPELREVHHLVCEAIARWKREEYAPLIPSVILGVSDASMSAGEATNYAAGENRFDMDAIAFWELRNFGFGDQAARRDARSVVEQTRWRKVELMDLVAREVTEAQVQVMLRDQIKIAEQGIRVAVQSYQLNIDRIEQAKGLPIEVLQSLQALDQARREYLRTVLDCNAAQFTLLRALGWPDHTDVHSPAREHESASLKQLTRG